MTYYYSREKVLCSIISLLLFCISINAQTNTYNFDTNDVIIIKSPSKNYNDILLQSHNDLPRFGALNRYVVSRGKREPNAREKSRLVGASYSSYIGLIQMNYMESIYNDFNREVFTYATSNNMSKKEKNSVIAQRHFSELSRTVCTKEAGNINAGTNEFERRRNYKEYVSNNLDGLRKWSSTILKNNTVTGYWVNSVRLTDYDFDKKGYWLHIPISLGPQRNSLLSFFSNFTPKANYENELPVKQNKRGIIAPLKVLFKISLEEAEKLQPKQQAPKYGRTKPTANALYITAKVKVTLKEFSVNKNMGRPDILYFEHHFVSPIITLYKDEALIEKAGEISLENLIIKNLIMMVVKNLKALFIISFLVFYTIANAQTKTTDSINKIGYDDIKTFKSSSQNFIPLVLQTHKGLLRFGKQNSYSLLPDGSHLSHKIVQAKGIDKNAKLSESRQAFIQLLRMKYMADKYKDLDKESFTVRASSMYKKDKNSLQAQNQLLKLANAVSSVSLMVKYFCNPKVDDCNYKTENFYRGIRNINPWGGKGANEFKRLNSYTSYVSQHLESLQKWSTNLFINNTIGGYLVLTSRLGTYDFKNKGFWLSFHSSQSNWFFLRFFDLAPNTIYERKLTSSNTSSILYKMPPNIAEQFSEKTKTIYMVFKIKVLLKGIDPYREAIKSSFSLENSIIELYDTEDLKTKIGEILIDENLSVK